MVEKMASQNDEFGEDELNRREKILQELVDKYSHWRYHWQKEIEILKSCFQ